MHTQIKLKRVKAANALLHQQNGAAIAINTIARGVVRQIRFRSELKQYKENTAMKDKPPLN